MNNMQKEAITASIIIVNYKVAQLINDCIQSIFDDPLRPDCEIILIDNSCDAEEKKAVENIQKKWNQINLIINKENAGFAKGNNQGLSIARGEHIVLLNPDTLVTHGWFTNMKSILENNPEIGLVSPLTNKAANYGALEFDSNYSAEEVCGMGITVGKLLSSCHIEMKTLSFFCAMGLSSIFKKVGKLNEDFIAGGYEDDDYCLRIAEKGHKLALCLSSFVYHAQSKSFETIEFTERFKIAEKNKIIFEKKWGKYNNQLELKNFFYAMAQLLEILPKKLDPELFHLLDLPRSLLKSAEKTYQKTSSKSEEVCASLKKRATSKEDIILEKKFRISELKKQILKYEKILNKNEADERQKLLFLQNEARLKKEERIKNLQNEIQVLKNNLNEKENLIALGLKNNHDQSFAKKIGIEYESLKEENNNLKINIESLENQAEKNKKVFQYFFQKMEDMPQVLNNLLGNKAYKLIMFFRVFSAEIKTYNIKRILEFFRRSFSYAKGNRGVLSRYISEDPFFIILEKLHIINTRLFSSRALHFNADVINIDDIEETKNEIQRLASSSSLAHDSLESPDSVAGKEKSIAIFTNRLLDAASENPGYGGGERYCIALVKLLRSQGFDVDIYQLGHETFEGIYENLKVTAIPVGNKSYSEFNLSATDRFYEISLKYGRVIYFLPELCAGKMRPDAISVCHGIWFDHNNPGPNTHYRTKDWYFYLNRVFSNPQLTVSVDTNSISIVRSLWPQMADKMRFIPNFYDPESFSPPEQPRNNDPVIILFPRRSQVNRGSRILEEIISQIPHNADIHWVGKGDRADTRIIKDLCRKDSRLSFHEGEFDSMSEWYKRADICVIPTIACEGTSLSCIEGLASGCAVVSTNVGGLPDLIQDQINGRLVDPFANDIARAINDLIENPQERLRLQKAGTESAKRFNIHEWEKKWTAILKHLRWVD